MVTEQETLIYIEDKEKKDASAAANAFAHKDTKNRAYINTLGADLALKYLASENIDVSNVYNIHSIKKILEEMDISDIMLPNIHIDVRVVFDENVIFIPKSHFEYNIEPDIYLVFSLAKDFSHVKFLGFFEPRLINKNNANDKYYFIEKEKLSSVVDLKKYIESHKGDTKETLSQEDLENSERIIISMADNDISENDKKYLIKQLTKSAELRDKFIEYENFETLSYKAMTDPQIKRKEIEAANSAQIEDISILDELENMNDIQVDEIPNETNSSNISLNSDTTSNDDTVSIDKLEELNLEPINDIESTAIDYDENNEDNKTNSTDANTFTPLDNIGTTIAEGIASPTAAAAAGEILNTAATANTALNIADTTLDIVDSGIELAKDLINNDTATPEPISFDNVDTSKIENITEVPQDNAQSETISLEDIQLSEGTENTDFIDKIDNKISFDDVQTDNLLNEPVPMNIDENSISLDNIDTTDFQNQENLDNFNNDNMISLDNLSQNTPNIDETKTNDSFSSQNIDENNQIDIDLDSSTTIENTESENLQSNEADNIELNDFMDDTLSLDDISESGSDLNNEISISDNQNENTNDDENTNIENFDEPNSEINQNTNLEPEIIEDETIDDNSKAESFGKNLMENLSSENLDDISIEDLSLDENTPHENENISSDELLSQIDDILNTSDLKNSEVDTTNNSTENNQSTNQFDNTIDEIPDIADLADGDINYNNSTNSINNIENLSDDEISNLLEDNTTQNNSENTNIDDLLNFDDSTNDNEDNQKNYTEDDNIDVLFNDTDPTSDPELDDNNIDTDTQIQQNQIPGAALYNKNNKTSSKKGILVVAALITVIAAASAVMILKPKEDTSVSDLEPISTNANENENANNTNVDTTENILATNAPDINNTKKEVQKKQTVTEIKNNTTKTKPSNSESYLTVNKLVWDVPSSLSYSSKFQNYLRTAGKSVKLSLSADLLLATEYAYTNQVKVNLQLSKDGAVQDAKIASSSGSTQIDNIVLQSVKNTLNVVKPPVEDIKTPNFNLSLIIYF